MNIRNCTILYVVRQTWQRTPLLEHRLCVDATLVCVMHWLPNVSPPCSAGTSSMSGVVYIADETHKQLLDETYCMFSWTNPLHADVFPSVGLGGLLQDPFTLLSCRMASGVTRHCLAFRSITFEMLTCS